MTEKNYRMALFVAGLLSGGILTGLWFYKDQISLLAPQNTESNTIPTVSFSTDTSGSISVLDQKPGETVAVESVTVPPPGVWVAIRDLSGENLGNVLGAARARGPISDLVVPLLRSTVPLKEYAVVLYRDNGDDVFDLHTESIYIDFDTGRPVVAPFITHEK